jgi:hypothetical protein
MTIDDWFADRQDGSFGDALDDEAVEFTAFAEIPPEFPHEPLEERTADADVDALRRRNGLPTGRQGPSSEHRSAESRAAGSAPAEAAEPAVPWHLRDRILDAARVYGSGTAKEIATEVRRKGANVATAQVAEVLRSLTASERAHVHPQQTAVQREARQIPARLGRPLPQRPGSAPPQPPEVTRPMGPPETCPACGVRMQDRGLCACS